MIPELSKIMLKSDPAVKWAFLMNVNKLTAKYAKSDLDEYLRSHTQSVKKSKRVNRSLNNLSKHLMEFSSDNLGSKE